MKQAKGPEFIRFFRPILELLLESGGTGTPSEIVDRSIEIAKVSESEQEAVNKNGQSRIKNQVHQRTLSVQAISGNSNSLPSTRFSWSNDGAR
jgi:hypothetical protein